MIEYLKTIILNDNPLEIIQKLIKYYINIYYTPNFLDLKNSCQIQITDPRAQNKAIILITLSESSTIDNIKLQNLLKTNYSKTNINNIQRQLLTRIIQKLINQHVIFKLTYFFNNAKIRIINPPQTINIYKNYISFITNKLNRYCYIQYENPNLVILLNNHNIL